MAIKDILVVCDGTEGSIGAVRYALGLAIAHDAHLTGIVTHGISMVLAQLNAWAPEEVFAAVAENEAALRDEIRAGVRAATDPAGRGDKDQVLSRAARCYDLVVMGPRQATPDMAHFMPHPDVMAVRGGRPVIFVPEGVAYSAATGKAVLAWDGGAAAAHAMSASLDLLRGMKVVDVVTVGGDVAPGGTSATAAVRHLLRHGVAAEARVVARDRRSIGDTLIETAKGADLLVMGAYEHSKLAEDLFGGTTDRILRTARTPVLMTH